ATSLSFSLYLHALSCIDRTHLHPLHLINHCEQCSDISELHFPAPCAAGLHASPIFGGLHPAQRNGMHEHSWGPVPRTQPRCRLRHFHSSSLQFCEETFRHLTAPGGPGHPEHPVCRKARDRERFCGWVGGGHCAGGGR
ncbi:hypothetical protein C8R44DRAFT_933570, partial [Mycena epipterygia]